MFITIDPDDPRPIYHQVADSIRVLIAGHDLAPGAALPPVRQVAADLGVSQNTIALAYRVLQDEGLVEIRHGSGAVVTERPRPTGAASEELRRQLRSLLAQLMLGGLARPEIVRVVREELEELGR
jgi:DNA-binding transcriptional regulator YhcF (GntR family)